ncbi:hypothetical protein BS333_17775 [Vibrio azureus]|nr:hypothetical protein [Vibrio azureus]AUI88205.1 hypothetical protein BS333_17775 [Vibrio azureus]
MFKNDIKRIYNCKNVDRAINTVLKSSRKHDNLKIDKIATLTSALLSEKETKNKLLQSIDNKSPDKAATVIGNLPKGLSKDVLESISPGKAARILMNLPLGKQLDILTEMSPTRAVNALFQMPPSSADKIIDKLSIDIKTSADKDFIHEVMEKYHPLSGLERIGMINIQYVEKTNIIRGGAPYPPGHKREGKVDYNSDVVSALLRAEVRHVISFNEFLSPEISELDHAGITFTHFPTEDFTPPQMTDIQRASEICSNMTDGNVFIHCGAGFGRTGTVISGIEIIQDGTKKYKHERTRAYKNNGVETIEQVKLLDKLYETVS